MLPLGFKIIDYNDGTPPLGFAKVQAMIKNGRRVSAERAYLRPIKNRRNLQITLQTTATKVLIDPITKRAYGVEMYRKGVRYEVRARKEVILSAGALQSPQLLMLSGMSENPIEKHCRIKTSKLLMANRKITGIGPKQHLEKLHIPIIQDLPGVGQNLQEHVCYSGLTFLVNETNVGVTTDQLLNFNNVLHFFERGKGEFLLNIAFSVITF